jgi:hypothetical protein
MLNVLLYALPGSRLYRHGEGLVDAFRFLDFDKDRVWRHALPVRTRQKLSFLLALFASYP